ncbi:hypothetical protein ACH0BU_17770 [Sphingomonas olei]
MKPEDIEPMLNPLGSSLKRDALDKLLGRTSAGFASDTASRSVEKAHRDMNRMIGGSLGRESGAIAGLIDSKHLALSTGSLAGHLRPKDVAAAHGAAGSLASSVAREMEEARSRMNAMLGISTIRDALVRSTAGSVLDGLLGKSASGSIGSLTGTPATGAIAQARDKVHRDVRAALERVNGIGGFASSGAVAHGHREMQRLLGTLGPEANRSLASSFASRMEDAHRRIAEDLGLAGARRAAGLMTASELARAGTLARAARTSPPTSPLAFRQPQSAPSASI